jgi:hypothetical protein
MIMTNFRPRSPFAMLLLLNLLLLASGEAAIAGAWTQSAKGYFFKLSGNYLKTNGEFDGDGNEVDLFTPIEGEDRSDGEFRDVNASAYLEYGAIERVTLIGQVAVKHVTSRYVLEQQSGSRREIETSTFGFGDLTAGIRYGITSRPVALSIQAAAKVPLGYDREPPGGEPPLGNGETDFEVKGLAGFSFYPVPIYLTGGAGIRARGGDAENEVLYEAEAGYATPGFLAKITVDIVDSRGEAASAGDFASVTGEADFVKLLPGVAARIAPGTWLTADVIHVMDGTNTLAGTTLSVGVAYTK